MIPKYHAFIYILCFCASVAFGVYDWNTNLGDGSESDPYQISTAEQLASIGSDAVLVTNHYILMNDIDMTGYIFDNSPIAPDTDQSSNSYTAENRFSGSLNGNYHRIRNLNISSSETRYNIGLIGLTTTSDWKIINLGLENLKINIGNSSQYIGGFTARGFGGSISSCYVQGSITSGTSSSYMGGFIGIGSATQISNCYAICTITNGTSSTNTGGLAGSLAGSSGLMDKCYSAGIVDSDSTASSIGTLVGRLVTGAVVTNCYFLNTTGPDNGIGEPKTFHQLCSVATYINWDFIQPPGDGEGNWRMRVDQLNYPYLSWEFIDSDFYGDFRIDLMDFSELAYCWQTEWFDADFNWLCDLNGNDRIEIGDLHDFCDNWMTLY